MYDIKEMQVTNVQINLSKFQFGELQKKFNEELAKVVQSFLDTSIDLDAKRKIDISFVIEKIGEDLIVKSVIGSKIPKRNTRPTYLSLQRIGNSKKIHVIENNFCKELDGQISIYDLLNNENIYDNDDDEEEQETEEIEKNNKVMKINR